MTKIVLIGSGFVVTSSLASLVASSIVPNPTPDDQLEFVHHEVEPIGNIPIVVLLGLEDYYPEGVIGHGSGFIEKMNLPELQLINEMDMPDFLFMERETFPLDFTRPIIKDQVMLRKPPYAVRKIIA